MSYTRTEGHQLARDPTIPRFHTEAVEDPSASAAAGYPVYFDEERVQYINPGNPNSPVQTVTDEHRERWPVQYKMFKGMMTQATVGTAIERWPTLTVAMVKQLKALDLHTVESCADMSDLAAQKIMGGMRIRQLAQIWLDEAGQMAATTQAIDRADKADARVSDLEAQLAALRPLMDKMHADMMELRNSPSAAAGYIPAAHDPVQMAQDRRPAPDLHASALEALPLPARRGRPPNPRQEAAA